MFNQQVSSTPLSSMLSTSHYISTVYLGAHQLFCQSHKNCWLVHTETGAVSQLPDLNPPKVYVGLIHHANCVYAFCGRVNDSPSRLCSAFNLKELHWMHLPEAIQA